VQGCRAKKVFQRHPTRWTVAIFLLEGTKHYVGMASKKLEKVEKLATAKNKTARGSQEKSDPEATTKVVDFRADRVEIETEVASKVVDLLCAPFLSPSLHT